MIDRNTAAIYALLALAAERMIDQGSDTPALPPEIAADWSIVGYISGANALFGTQALGLGDRCYYGFVARSIANPSSHVCAIRGTELALEWMENCEALPQLCGHGFVHHGFYSIYSSFRYETADAQQGGYAWQSLASLDAGSLTFVGHSLGSALATYLMADTKMNARCPVYGTLFASPKPGDANYAHWVDATMGRDNYAVYNYSRDIVPRLPFGLPFGLGFQSLPNVVWLTPSMSGAKIPDGVQAAHSLVSYHDLLSTAVAEAA